MPQTWLMTGCSSGFGELFVRQLRESGDNVIATGRNAETRLAHLEDTGAVIMDLDVSALALEIASKMAEAWVQFLALQASGRLVYIKAIKSSIMMETYRQQYKWCMKQIRHKIHYVKNI